MNALIRMPGKIDRFIRMPATKDGAVEYWAAATPRWEGEMLIEQLLADSDEAGQAFQFEAGHPFRFEAGHGSDLKSATWRRPRGSRG